MGNHSKCFRCGELDEFCVCATPAPASAGQAALALPDGWNIERFDKGAFKNIKITGPNGINLLAGAYAMGFELILYKLGSAILAAQPAEGSAQVAIYQWRKRGNNMWHDTTQEDAYSRVDEHYEARTVYAQPAEGAGQAGQTAMGDEMLASGLREILASAKGKEGGNYIRALAEDMLNELTERAAQAADRAAAGEAKEAEELIALAIRDVCELDEAPECDDTLTVTVGTLQLILERHFAAGRAAAPRPATGHPDTPLHIVLQIYNDADPARARWEARCNKRPDIFMQHESPEAALSELLAAMGMAERAAASAEVMTLLQDAARAWNNEAESELDAAMERIECFLLDQRATHQPIAQDGGE